MGLVAVAAGDLDQLKPVAGLVVGGGQLGAQPIDDRGGLLEQLGEKIGGDRLDGDHHDRLDRSHRFGIEFAVGHR